MLLISEVRLKTCTVAERDKMKILIFVFGAPTLSLGTFSGRGKCALEGPRPVPPPPIVAWPPVLPACQQDTADSNGECPSAGQSGSPSTRFRNHF